MSTYKQELPTAEHRESLCDLMDEAFVDLHYLPAAPAQGLAYAFHNLLKTMYGWGQRSVEGARARLMHYQTKHAANLVFDCVTVFDSIFTHS